MSARSRWWFAAGFLAPCGDDQVAHVGGGREHSVVGQEVLMWMRDENSLAKEFGRFDTVHHAEMLEHIPDPAAMLSRCRDLLLPGGIRCVSVPNDLNPFQ